MTVGGVGGRLMVAELLGADLRGAEWGCGEGSGLPEQEDLFQAAEDAREDDGDEGVQGSGHGSAIIV